MTIDATPIVGLRIRLRRTIDTPCAACGGTTVAVGEGVGPHVAALHCPDCRRHRGWLSRPIAEFLVEIVARFGQPHEPILIRNHAIADAPSPRAPAISDHSGAWEEDDEV